MYPGEATIELLDFSDLESRRQEHLAEVLDPQGNQNNANDFQIVSFANAGSSQSLLLY